MMRNHMKLFVGVILPIAGSPGCGCAATHGRGHPQPELPGNHLRFPRALGTGAGRGLRQRHLRHAHAAGIRTVTAKDMFALGGASVTFTETAH